MVRLGTAEWWQLVADRLNASELGEDAPDFTFKFIFLVDEDRKTYFQFVNGKVTEVHALQPGDEDAADVIAEGTPDTWAKMSSGELAAELALMLGKFKLVKGSKTKLLKNLGAAGEIFTQMKEVPFEV